MDTLTATVSELQERCERQSERIKQLMDVNAKLKTDNDRLTKTTLQMKDEKGRFCSFVHPCV